MITTVKTSMAEEDAQEDTKFLKVLVTGFGVRVFTILELFDSAVTDRETRHFKTSRSIHHGRLLRSSHLKYLGKVSMLR
jgi:hypothetical protein